MNFFFQNVLDVSSDKDKLTEKIYSIIPKEWEIVEEVPWLITKPNNGECFPEQGWKGHISATIADSIKIIEIALPILIKYQCSFKILKNLKLLSVVNDINYPVAAANKFITFYPTNENIFIKCIYELYDKLKQFKGPRIHTDFQCGRNGVVHFRYGAFTKKTKFDPKKNKIINCIKNDKGELVEDERNPWYEKPSWVKDPFENTELFRDSVELTNSEIEKINKYDFLSILSRANKGNVYLAKERNTGKNVVIKESNAYTFNSKKITTAHEGLENEFRVLKAMNKTNCVPKVYDFFECGTKAYLVEEYIDGVTLMKYSQVTSGNINNKLKLAHNLIRSVELMHQCGYVHRDIKPTNIMVSNDGELKFIDLETALHLNADNEIYFVKTEGFYNPEFDISESINNDWYGVVITIITLFLGTIPYFHKDSINGNIGERRVMSKLVKYIEKLFNADKLNDNEYKILKNVIEKKMLHNYINLLDDYEISFNNVSVSYVIENVIKGFYDECYKNFNANNKRLWNSTEFGNSTNYFNIQHGIAGTGQFIIKYYKEQKGGKELSRKTLELFSKYIKQNIYSILNPTDDKGYQNSFLFGVYGFSWFLYDLGECLGDQELINYSKKLADLDSVDSCLDFALGKSGQAYNCLKFWVSTGDRKYYQKMVSIVDSIINDTTQKNNPIVSHSEKFNTYGFAHGTAGIAYTVYLAGLVTNNNYYKEYAIQKVEQILEFYENIINERISISWCNGLAGVGISLVRMNQFINNPRISNFLCKLPKILVERMWYQSPCLCHGNSSSIEFLMDAYQITKDYTFYNAAKEISDFVLQQFFYGQNGTIRFPNETKVFDVYDYGVGTFGTIQALDRVENKYSKPLFMLDEIKLLDFVEANCNGKSCV